MDPDIAATKIQKVNNNKFIYCTLKGMGQWDVCKLYNYIFC